MDRGKFVGRIVASAGLVAVAALAACTGPGPIVTETPSASSTPAATASASASPTPTALTDAELLELLPPEAASPDEAGAVATAEFVVALAGPLYDGRGADLYRQLTTANCMFCADALARSSEFIAEGGVREGGEIRVAPSETRHKVDEETGNVGVWVTFEQAQSIETAGDGTVEVFPTRTIQVLVEMTRVGDIWKLNGLAILD